MLNEFVMGKVTLEKLLVKEDYRKLFNDYYIPDIEVMGDGRIFIDSERKELINGNINQIKFILVDNRGNITQDSESKYIELLKEGYLIRLLVPRPFTPESISVSYIVDINNIAIMKTHNENTNIETDNPLVTTEYEFETESLYLERNSIFNKDNLELFLNKDMVFEKYIKWFI